MNEVANKFHSLIMQSLLKYMSYSRLVHVDVYTDVIEKI